MAIGCCEDDCNKVICNNILKKYMLTLLTNDKQKKLVIKFKDSNLKEAALDVLYDDIK